MQRFWDFNRERLQERFHRTIEDIWGKFRSSIKLITYCYMLCVLSCLSDRFSLASSLESLLLFHRGMNSAFRAIQAYKSSHVFPTDSEYNVDSLSP